MFSVLLYKNINKYFSFRYWTDFGECNLAAVDFRGTLVLNICENFYNKEIIKDFIDSCKEVEIHFEIESEYEYEQYLPDWVKNNQ